MTSQEQANFCAIDLDIKTLKCLLWLILFRCGGSVTFTRKELDQIPLEGEMQIADNANQITVKAIYEHTKRASRITSARVGK